MTTPAEPPPLAMTVCGCLRSLRKRRKAYLCKDSVVQKLVGRRSPLRSLASLSSLPPQSGANGLPLVDAALQPSNLQQFFSTSPLLGLVLVMIMVSAGSFFPLKFCGKKLLCFCKNGSRIMSVGYVCAFFGSFSPRRSQK